MTFNECIYFIVGVYLGGWTVRPLVDIVKTIWKNAKDATNRT